MTNRQRIKLLKEWVKELRSGEYNQIQRSLHTDDGFCGLGVLCDIAIDDDWVFVKRDGNWLPSHWKMQGFSAALPDKLREDLKITDIQQWNLIAMNDNEGKSFNEVADWIEENLINEQV